ncbi:MAG: cytochrome c biogenesis protein CcsA, partial [Anaerohalosphaera sp.]|nr:cytochrome c biogenesis protein CcsA [Anaerohalosphaera sp.]
YWAWDPVENSSLMPWITGTALVHCFRAYNIRGKTATWTVILSLITFGLCIFSTFLTRSGLVASVHAFPEPGMSIWFMYLIGLMTVITAVLMCKKYFRKDSQHHTLEGPSQYYMVLNNYLMLALTLVILIGTLFPFLTQVAGQFVKLEQITLEPEFFNKVTSPLGIILLLFIALCPYLWVRGFNISWRVITACVFSVIALVLWIVTKALAPVFFVLSALLLVTLIADAITFKYSMSKRTLSWLGSRLVHLGVALIFIGIAGSGGYDFDEQFAMRPGQDKYVELGVDRILTGFAESFSTKDNEVETNGAEVDDKAGLYRIVFDDLSLEDGPNFEAAVAKMSIYSGEDLIAELRPAKAYYPKSDKSFSEVAVRRTLGGDLYLALTGVDTRYNLINIRILVKPLINWIWIGSILMILGTFPALGAVRNRDLTGEKK